MSTTFDTQTTNVINCSSLENFQTQILSIYEQIEKAGFVVIQAWDTSEETFKEIARFFGYSQDHPNADDFGVIKVRPERPKNKRQTLMSGSSPKLQAIFCHTQMVFT